MLADLAVGRLAERLEQVAFGEFCLRRRRAFATAGFGAATAAAAGLGAACGGKKSGRSASAIEGGASGASSREIHERPCPKTLADVEPRLAPAASAFCPAACSQPRPWPSIVFGDPPAAAVAASAGVGGVKKGLPLPLPAAVGRSSNPKTVSTKYI